MIDIRPVAFAVGAFVAILAPLMLVCAVVDLDADNPDWMVFVASSVVVFGFGSMVALATRTDQFRFDVRQGFLLTVAVWCAMALVGATPFYFASLNADFADSVFEAVSGITTTGSTVLNDLDHMPPGILLWRALLQWIGGIGIIATALIVFPFLQVSGMQLFKMESSDVSEKYTARIADTTSRIALLYFGLTVATAVALIAAGMPAFDAVCHAMTAVSTGGFGTHDSSVGYYGSREIEVILVVAMLAGSLTFVLMMQALTGGLSALLRDPQTRLFFSMIAIAVICIAGWRIATSDVVPLDAVWSTLFSVVSIITTTGFVTDDYSAWGA
ncbi:MAG: TrkH family potassium uptake protein, partial [Hyphomicrobiales bacterium]|nr:TrkH family potassium uptake protein [Hyphomicrobiales bacterium]